MTAPVLRLSSFVPPAAIRAEDPSLRGVDCLANDGAFVLFYLVWYGSDVGSPVPVTLLDVTGTGDRKYT